MKPSEMTNEMLAKELDNVLVNDELQSFADVKRQQEAIEEAIARLRTPTIRSDNSAVVAELERRLEAVVKECEREISFRQKTAARCEMCMEDSSAGEDCPYCGEPNGCNSPIYGEFPTEKECEPFNAILRAARGEGGAE